MKIYQGVGANPPTIRHQKNGGDLLFVASSSDFDKLLNARMSVILERANGENIQVCQNVTIGDYAILNRLGNDSLGLITSKSSYLELSLGSNGNIHLGVGDQLAFTFNGFSADSETRIHLMDETVASNSVVKHEIKVMGAEQNRQVFTVAHCEAIFVPNFANVVDSVIFILDDGKRLEYSADELLYMSSSMASLKAISDDGTLQLLNQDNAIIQTVGVTTVEIIKRYDLAEAKALNIHFQYDMPYLNAQSSYVIPHRRATAELMPKTK
nr:hypothetical protein [uncultured Flavobacterium sp.]